MLKRTTIAAAGATALLAAADTAVAAEPSKGLRDGYLNIYERVDKLGGEPGRNIVLDGVRENGKPRGAERKEVIRSIRTLRRTEAALRAPAGRRAVAAPSRSGVSGGGAGAGLEAIAACESGGNPAAVSPDGRYRGKYQFDRQTWQAVGGSGDPAAAPEAEQDRRAAALMAQAGRSPWPTCGR